MTNPALIFVSKRLCERLAERGLTLDTWAVWREYSGVSDEQPEQYIVAPGLDLEGLYKPLDLPKGVMPRIYRDTPAYTLTDMLSLIPGFCMNAKDPMHIEIASFSMFQLESIAGKHSLPDAAAMMVLHILEKRVLPVETMNELLLKDKIAKP